MPVSPSFQPGHSLESPSQECPAPSGLREACPVKAGRPHKARPLVDLWHTRHMGSSTGHAEGQARRTRGAEPQSSSMIEGRPGSGSGRRGGAKLLLVALTVAVSVLLSCANAQDSNATVPSVCFEKVSDIPGIYLSEHPAGGKLVVATQDGTIRLTTLPVVGSGQLAVEFNSTFLDLTARVRNKGEQGLLSFAFHPDFLNNGRFFVSYICDAGEHEDCQGPCAVGTECPYHTIVSEFSAGADPANATSIEPDEVRKILNFGRPFENHNGGHIWFGTDGYLYYTSGDGGSQKDPLGTAQNGSMPLGKILRLDVDGTPTANEWWGNYSIPLENPFVDYPGVMGEIYALGLRNPWRCSVDVPTNVTLCGDVGQDAVEEVDIILKGMNYGWSYFEGPNELKPEVPSTPILSSKQGLVFPAVFSLPVFYYDHEDYEVEGSDRGLAVIGGHVYRAPRNPCLQEKYIFGDEYGVLFLGDLYPPGSPIPYNNGSYSPTSSAVAFGEGTSGGTEEDSEFPADDLLFSWGTDSAGELYRLSSSGIFRVTDSALCNMTCEGAFPGQKPAPPPPLVLPPAAPPTHAPNATPALPPDLLPTQSPVGNSANIPLGSSASPSALPIPWPASSPHAPLGIASGAFPAPAPAPPPPTPAPNAAPALPPDSSQGGSTGGSPPGSNGGSPTGSIAGPSIVLASSPPTPAGALRRRSSYFFVAWVSIFLYAVLFWALA